MSELEFVLSVCLCAVWDFSFFSPLLVSNKRGDLFQECPTGMVDEDSFKQIFAQFFPLGGKFRIYKDRARKPGICCCYSLVCRPIKESLRVFYANFMIYWN